MGEVDAHRLDDRVGGRRVVACDREQLVGDEREARAACAKCGEDEAKRSRARERVDIAAMTDREQRRSHGKRGECGRREPVRDDQIPASVRGA